MKPIRKSAMTLAAAAKGCPVTTTVVVFLFYLFFNMLEALVETLAFGGPFEHWLDPLFVGCFIAYSAYAVYGCAMHNTHRK